MVDLIVKASIATNLYESGTAPTQVVGVAANNVKATALDLSWAEATNASTYTIFVDGEVFTSAVGLSTTLTGLSPETAYSIQVQGINNLGESGNISVPIIATTGQLPEWLFQDFQVLFEVGQADTRDVSVFISPQGAVGTYSVLGGSLPDGVTLNANTGVFTYDGVGAFSALEAVTYRFDNGVDEVADADGHIGITDTVIPAQVTGLSASSISSSGFSLSWTPLVDVGLQGYRIFRDGVLFLDTANTIPSANITGQVAGSSHLWRVLGYDGNNVGPQSNALNVQQLSNVFTWVENATVGLQLIPGAIGLDFTAGSGRHDIQSGLGAVVSVYFVDTINPTGAGSLKQALEATGHRIIIPATSGLIDFSSVSDKFIRITDGNLIYAGQCAPAPGLFVHGCKIIVGFNTAASVGNCLFSHLGVFAGTTAHEDAFGFGTSGPRDDVGFNNCLFAWGTDETVDFTRVGAGITMYECMVSESWLTPNDPASNRSFGVAVSNDSNIAEVNFIRTVFAHNRERNPMTRAKLCSILNCLMFDFPSRGIQLTNKDGILSDTNIEGCVFMTGPGGNPSRPIQRQPANLTTPYLDGSRFYLANNVGIGFNDSPQSALVLPGDGTQSGSRLTGAYPTGYNVTTNSNAADLARLITRFAGPRPANRIASILRVTGHIEARLVGSGAQGGLVTSAAEAGGVPSLAVNTVNHTQGADPIPGIVNQVTGAIPLGAAGRTIHASGYTELERWLHRKHDAVMPTA